MSKYKNICNFLYPTYKVISTLEEFTTTQKIIFKCALLHENILSSASFSNKRYKVPIESFCSSCVKDLEISQKRMEYIDTIKEKTGHNVLQVDFTTRFVEYECGNCGSKQHSKAHNLHKNTGVCSSCQNDKHKLSFLYVKKIAEEHGMKLLLNDSDYTNNKQILPLKCKCGRPHQAVLSDIKKDKHCQECKKEKYKETCLEKYGVENAHFNQKKSNKKVKKRV